VESFLDTASSDAHVALVAVAAFFVVGPPAESSTMLRRSYALTCYLVFLASFLYAIGFVGDMLVPKTIDAPVAQTGWPAFLVDALVLGAFAVQHSVMARPAFKRWWTRFVASPIERSTYVLLSSLLLGLVFVAWRPLPVLVWDVRSTPLEPILIALQVLGWLIVLLSTFMISHFELFGLTQAWRGARAQSPHTEAPFVERFFYRFVRHPIMLGFLVAFWATPAMSQGHLLFALLTSGYILVGVHLEEADLRAKIGRDYEDYRARVPMLVPFTKPRD
jgi:protein-S-isoprenylcysteine O-methyltransferase Ste14